MKKTYIFLVFALSMCMLTGCLQERFRGDKLNIVYADGETKELNDKISKIEVDEYDLDDLIDLLGNPKKYIWGEEEFRSKELPEVYIMVYSEDFHIFMIDNKIAELRFYNSPSFVKDTLYVGQRLEEVEEVLGEPKEVVNGKEIGFEDGVLYKDILGEKGHCYYSRYDKNVRMFFTDNKINALYVLRSDFNELMENSREKFKNKVKNKDNKRVKIDKIDYPFVNDEKIIGTWKSVDFVKEIDAFTPNMKKFIGNLYLKEMIFKKDGKTFKSFWTWTKGIIIHHGDETASKYVIKEIDGEEYMFFEWKSGDYTYRGMEPKYYVLKKVKE